MLFVTIRSHYDPGETTTHSWHVGQNFIAAPHDDHKGEYVSSVQADGDELEFLFRHGQSVLGFPATTDGVPMTVPVMAWYGEKAQWVVANLISQYDEYV